MLYNISTCQYQIEMLSDWHAYMTKITSLIAEAKQQNSQLLLLPEYAGVEIVCTYFDTEEALFKALQPLIPKYIDFYKNIAQQHQIYIQPGSIIEEISPNRYVNRAYFFGPNGNYGYQDKMQLTEIEKNTHVIERGKKQHLFKTSFATVGIAICYDSEFPEIVRHLSLSGAELILVPSYTSSLAGYYRVMHSCLARAIENQCIIAVSYVVNDVVLSGGVDNTYGQAVILGPADNGFPDDGIIASGKMNENMIVTAEISIEKIYSVRKQGQVHTFEDAKHYKLPANEITILDFMHC